MRRFDYYLLGEMLAWVPVEDLMRRAAFVCKKWHGIIHGNHDDTGRGDLAAPAHREGLWGRVARRLHVGTADDLDLPPGDPGWFVLGRWLPPVRTVQMRTFLVDRCVRWLVLMANTTAPPSAEGGPERRREAGAWLARQAFCGMDQAWACAALPAHPGGVKRMRAHSNALAAAFTADPEPARDVMTPAAWRAYTVAGQSAWRDRRVACAWPTEHDATAALKHALAVAFVRIGLAATVFRRAEDVGAACRTWYQCGASDRGGGGGITCPCREAPERQVALAPPVPMAVAQAAPAAKLFRTLYMVQLRPDGPATINLADAAAGTVWNDHMRWGRRPAHAAPTESFQRWSLWRHCSYRIFDSGKVLATLSNSFDARAVVAEAEALMQPYVRAGPPADWQAIRRMFWLRLGRPLDVAALQQQAADVHGLPAKLRGETTRHPHVVVKLSAAGVEMHLCASGKLVLAVWPQSELCVCPCTDGSVCEPAATAYMLAFLARLEAAPAPAI